MKKIIKVKSLKETFDLGKKIGQKLSTKFIILLTGNLGSGKTAWTKGLAKGLGIKSIVNSPTYTIINFYDEGRMKLYHIDFYRLNSIDDLENIGFDEILDDKAIIVIEWGDKFGENFLNWDLRINFEVLNKKERQISILGAKEIKWL